MLADGQYVRLETIGRKTRRPHSVIVRYVLFEGKLVVFPEAKKGQDWVANLKANPEVAVYGDKARWAGKAEWVTVAGLGDPVLAVFTRKYGKEEVMKRYWGVLNYFRIQLLSMRHEEYSELVYSDLEVAFDGVAETYDHHIMGNPMNLWLRNRSVTLMTRVFKPGDVVIEIGCGTGTETLSLARSGIKVLASDISSRMLEVLGRKAGSEGLGEMIVPIHCRPYELPRRIREAGYETVDGAYSTYGAINTEPRLEEMLAGLHQIVKNNGILVLGVWNKFCAYEILGYTLRMRPSMAAGRLRNPVPVGKSRFCVTTNAFSVGSLDEVVGKWFKRERVLGVEIILPPSNLVRYLPSGGALKLVQKVEVALEPHFPWNRLGDHFLGVYRKEG